MIFCTINELNLAWFILRSVLGRSVYLLALEPLIPSFRPRLERVIQYFADRNHVKFAVDIVPQLARYEEGDGEISYAAIYPRHDNIFNQMMQFDSTNLGDYNQIFRHASGCRLKGHLEKFPPLREMRPIFADQKIHMQGLPHDFCKMYEAIYGEPLGSGIGRSRIPRRILNFALTVGIGGALLFAIIRRLSFAPQRQRAFPFAADLAEEGRVRSFFNQISVEPTEIVFVLRNPQVRDNLNSKELSRYHHADLTEGHFTVREAITAAISGIRDSINIYMEISSAPTSTFLGVIKQVVNRIRFRAFLNCYALGAFMARDEYNTDHITRTQELRRAGTRSVGILHGMSTGPRVYPHTRYLDFDTLYLFGRRQSNAYIDNWPDTMVVRALGGYSLTREQIQRLGGPRSKDIAIFANQVTDTKEHVRISMAIADHFKDRTIYLKLKYSRNYVGSDLYQRYMDWLGDLPENLVLMETPPYDLLMDVGYSFSGLSTVVAEALQMGVSSYFIDTYDDDQDVFFRDFPALCIKTAETAIENIEAIERGEEVYPSEQFGDLIDLSGDNIFDVIRADLALPPWNDKSNCQAA